MSLDIGEALGEGLSRLSTRPGAALVVAFAAVGLLSAVLSQTLQVGALEALLEAARAASPEQLGLTQAAYDQQTAALEAQLEAARASPLALEAPPSVAAGGLVAVALVSEVISIVAVRAFAADDPATVGREVVDGLGMATLNGFVGGVVIWVLIIVGSILFVVPGLFAAVGFYFLRQEVALDDENVLGALAASWRLAKGNRVGVFTLALVVVAVSQLNLVVGIAIETVSPAAAAVASAVVGGVVAAFGAAAVTRGYLQLTDADDSGTETASDPYDAALGPDDIPE